MASSVYWLQDGKNRQDGGNERDKLIWYSRIAPIISLPSKLRGALTAGRSQASALC